MVTRSNILVVMVLILVCNCNTVICHVNGCSGRDFRCGPHGPPIRFPFRFKDREEKYGCSYPGFELTCSDTRKTLIELPTHSGPIQLEVKRIFYDDQELWISDPENCLPKQLLKLLHSQISPFQLFARSDSNNSYTFMDCSSLTCPVYFADSGTRFLDSGVK
ncbi:putative wall-associated receptor kinase, galacturonan-binding domain-containing protein [Medicago truncatula]|uniref:RING-type E3 ubiquitin transferase n=1 Tax=Medicago truncatula TaxID=3880 RepID=A0A396JT09_MEDTR|nr:putative wall-associated receptor kinase, galacturonan-binding domain-containing protein [Medicago truncatula]